MNIQRDLNIIQNKSYNLSNLYKCLYKSVQEGGIPEEELAKFALKADLDAEIIARLEALKKRHKRKKAPSPN